MLRRMSLVVALAGVVVLLTATVALAQGAQRISAGSVAGFVEVPSTSAVDDTSSRLQSSLESNGAVSVVASVDHSANAASVGQELRPTSLTLFGNPKLGTPLMQQSQTAGIDLPQKMLVREDAAGNVGVGYNSPEYLANRHSITGADKELQMIGGALSKLATGAAGSEASAATTGDANAVAPGEGLIVTKSAYGPEETFERLQGAVQSNENLSVVATVDHQANAESVGMDLRPTKLLIFGNPKAGTPLIQNAQTAGVDLPQKALVYEDASGQTHLAYNDPYYLADRHGITGAGGQLTMISTALEGLATEATGGEELPQTGGLSVGGITVGLSVALVALAACGLILGRVLNRRLS